MFFVFPFGVPALYAKMMYNHRQTLMTLKLLSEHEVAKAQTDELARERAATDLGDRLMQGYFCVVASSCRQVRSSRIGRTMAFFLGSTQAPTKLARGGVLVLHRQALAWYASKQSPAPEMTWMLSSQTTCEVTSEVISNASSGGAGSAAIIYARTGRRSNGTKVVPSGPPVKQVPKCTQSEESYHLGHTLSRAAHS